MVTPFIDCCGWYLKICKPTISREPAPARSYTRINIGDVGFIHRGQFHLLDSAFEAYTVRHYESWVAFARHKQYGNNVHPVLVSGVNMTRDFAMVAYSNRSTSQEPGPTIPVPMFASTSTSFRGTWRIRYLAHTNHGPQKSSPSPDGQARYTPSPL